MSRLCITWYLLFPLAERQQREPHQPRTLLAALPTRSATRAPPHGALARPARGTSPGAGAYKVSARGCFRPFRPGAGTRWWVLRGQALPGPGRAIPRVSPPSRPRRLLGRAPAVPRHCGRRRGAYCGARLRQAPWAGEAVPWGRRPGLLGARGRWGSWWRAGGGATRGALCPRRGLHSIFLRKFHFLGSGVCPSGRPGHGVCQRRERGWGEIWLLLFARAGVVRLCWGVRAHGAVSLMMQFTLVICRMKFHV